MEYRTLGRSGTVVSAQALGTMTFGPEADEATSHQILTAFAEGGGTFVDTADVYSAGVSEGIIGAGWPSTPPRPLRSSSPPRAGSPPALAPTMWGSPAVICA